MPTSLWDNKIGTSFNGRQHAFATICRKYFNFYLTFGYVQQFITVRMHFPR